MAARRSSTWILGVAGGAVMPMLLLSSRAGAGAILPAVQREHPLVPAAALAPILGEGLFAKYHGPVLIGLMALTAVVLLACNRRRRRAEAQLRRAHDELERRVRQRTTAPGLSF